MQFLFSKQEPYKDLERFQLNKKGDRISTKNSKREQY